MLLLIMREYVLLKYMTVHYTPLILVIWFSCTYGRLNMMVFDLLVE